MRKDDDHSAIRKPTLLWKSRGIRCSCLITAIDHIEISMTLDGVLLHLEVFADQEPAAQYAIDKMHAYDGR